jgi:hypothetical protein
MSSYITHTSGLPSSLWISPPSSIIPSLQFYALRQPTLGILHVYFAQFTQFSACDSRLCLLDCRIPRVYVGQCKNQSRLLHFIFQFEGFFQGKSHWFVDNNVKTSFQCHHGRFKMPFVRCDYGYKIHPLFGGQFCFFLKHLLVGVVNSVIREEVFPA